MNCKKLPLLVAAILELCHFAFGAAWEGADDFSSGISTNWIIQQTNHGSMTVQATNGHASFLVAPSTNSEQNAYLFWRGTPVLNQDWTVQISGHSMANWSNNGASQLQLMAGDLNTGEAFVIESYRGNDGIGFVTSMWQNNGVTTTTRQYVLATNTDFNLRLVYSAATGNIIAWYNLTGSWILLDTFNTASFPTSLPASDVFTFGIIADTYYGPLTEGQAHVDNFSLTNYAIPPLSQFICITNNGTITITGYAGSLVAADIPNTINGLPVTSIGTNAFYNCTNLVRVTIPDSVTNIGNSAFDSCVNLSTIIIGNNVRTIGDYAFNNCNGPDLWQNSVIIPNSVTTIGNFAFANNSDLNSVILGNGIKTIGDSAFAGSSLFYGVTIPNSVTNIGNGTFSGSRLQSISIPSNVITLGDSAFSDCTSLSSVTLGSGITSIGDSMFSNCFALPSVSIPNSVTNIGNNAFYHCQNLMSVAIGNSVTSIGDEAFYNCSLLTSITIPNSVTETGGDSFVYCSSLTNVIIGSGVTNMGFGKGIYPSLYWYGFSFGWDNLNGINVNPNNPSYSSINGILFDKNVQTLYFCPKNKIGSYTPPNSVFTIGWFAFYNCDWAPLN